MHTCRIQSCTRWLKDMVVYHAMVDLAAPACAPRRLVPWMLCRRGARHAELR